MSGTDSFFRGLFGKENKKKTHSSGNGNRHQSPGSKWEEKSCPGYGGYCGNKIKYRTDWDDIPSLCKECTQKQQKDSKPKKERKESAWREKSCPGAPGQYCGNTIKYRIDWSNIPTHCDSCRNREFEKKCSINGCDRIITYKLSYTNVRDVCGRCFKEMERGRQPKVCPKCHKVMFVAPGKDYPVCMDCSLAEQMEKHEALRKSVQGRRISGSASSLDQFARTLVQYLHYSDDIYFVELGGSARDEWKQPPMKRGERVDGGFDRGSLPYNFPVIDLWTNGDATSIKSLDLGAASYRNLNTLDRQIAGYIDDMAGYQGNRDPRWKPIIDPSEIKERTLLLVVPLIGARDYQLSYLYTIGNGYAQRKGVRVIVFIVD